MTLQLRPVDLTTAKRFVGTHHRHNLAPMSWKFGVGLESDGQLVGVCMLGRTTGRGLRDLYTAEVTRTCTLGTPNGNSMLYGAIARAAKALGYRTLYTYTLQQESGVSLKAAGWEVDALLDERPSWDTPSRSRIQTDLFGNERRPSGPKVRWIKRLC